MELESFLSKENFQKNYEHLFRYSLNILGDVESARDNVQEVYLKAISNKDKFRGGDFKSWIFTIAHHEAVRNLESSYGKRISLVENYYDFVVEGEDSYKKFEESEMKNFVSDSLGKLDRLWRVSLSYKYSWGFKSKEIAEILGVEEKTIKSRIHSGKKKLRKILEEEGFEYKSF